MESYEDYEVVQQPQYPAEQNEGLDAVIPYRRNDYWRRKWYIRRIRQMVIKSAIVFGMVASITFQTVNYAVEQLLGSRSTPESLTLTITENDATGVDGFQESVYVRYDVSDVVSKAMPSIVSITG